MAIVEVQFDDLAVSINVVSEPRCLPADGCLERPGPDHH
jgi:hypothetical protein